MKIFKCDVCGQILYYKNSVCLNCKSELGFLPEFRLLSSLENSENETYVALAPQASRRSFKKCLNYSKENVCNWMIPAESPDLYCFSCSLNKTIPNLAKPNNKFYWYRLEKAKRQLLYALLELGLPIVSRKEDPEHGLAFEFLEDEIISFRETKTVMTGHANGVITINLNEADDAMRAKMRVEMKEEYRTILGHFRHEIGHYYWNRLVQNSCDLEEFRSLFGDERKDYSEALSEYYEQGPSENWRDHYVSAYSASHPWEDWAESWAHYMHIVATLDTATSWGIRINPRPMNASEQETLGQQTQQSSYAQIQWANFYDMFEQWTFVTCAINSMNRSMGKGDFYPFALCQKAIEKLAFVDKIIKKNSLFKA